MLAGHGVHVAAAARENVPDGHKVHGCPADAYEPAVQGVQAEEKAAEEENFFLRGFNYLMLFRRRSSKATEKSAP